MKQNNMIIEIKFPELPKQIKKKIDKLNYLFLKSNEKVAYYYKDKNTGLKISYNENVTFYAASTIKILVLLYLYKNKVNLNTEIECKEEDKKQGTGVIKNHTLPRKYTIKELLKYTIQESDNTAYLKLVDWIGKEKLKEFGNSLNALYTLEGKDNFGIINCSDLEKYWEELEPILGSEKEIKEWFLNPRYQIIDEKNLRNKQFCRKYGAFDIAYHECGIVYNQNPYFLFILTQKGQNKKAKKFINKSAKMIAKIHEEINQ